MKSIVSLSVVLAASLALCAIAAQAQQRGYTAEVAQHPREVDYAHMLSHDRGHFEVLPLGINSPDNDFGPCIRGNQVVFASSQSKKMVAGQDDLGGTEYHLDLFVADRNPDFSLGNVREFDPILNGPLSEGPATFSADGNYMVFTSSDYNRRQTEWDNLKLYESYCIDGVWTKPRPLPINGKDYSMAHACLSADGLTLYFASDMPGGFGGSDLYAVHREKRGRWGKPYNLGAGVITAGDEFFPFYDETARRLFFASDTYPGIGGLDVFVAELSDSGFSAPKNLGAPINTLFDDFGFVLDASGEGGYFSSNREGNDDLYSFSIQAPIVFSKQLRGVVQNKNGVPLADATVLILNALGEQLAEVHTDQAGKYRCELAADTKELKLSISKPGFLPAETLLKLDYQDEQIRADVKLERDPCDFLYNAESPVFMVYFDFNARATADTHRLDSISECLRTNPNIKMELSGYTDPKGSKVYNQRLSRGRVDFVKNYLLSKGVKPEQIDRTQPMGEQNLLVPEQQGENYKQKYRRNRRVEINIKGATQ